MGKRCDKSRPAAKSTQLEHNPSSSSMSTACVIIPPEHLWGPINTIRKNHDKAWNKWMPHISIIPPPFLAEKILDTEAPIASLSAALEEADVQPFQVRLVAAEAAPQTKAKDGRVYVWLYCGATHTTAHQLRMTLCAHNKLPEQLSGCVLV